MSPVTTIHNTVTSHIYTKHCQQSQLTTIQASVTCHKSSAVSSPSDHSKRIRLHRHEDRSFRQQLHLSGKHSSQAAITREDYSLTLPLPSIVNWSVVKMAKLRHGSKGDSNPGSLDCESGILPLSYCAPHGYSPRSTRSIGNMTDCC